MDGAWSDNDQEAVIASLDDLFGGLATGDDGLGSSQGQGQVLHQDLGWDERADLLSRRTRAREGVGHGRKWFSRCDDSGRVWLCVW